MVSLRQLGWGSLQARGSLNDSPSPSELARGCKTVLPNVAAPGCERFPEETSSAVARRVLLMPSRSRAMKTSCVTSSAVPLNAHLRQNGRCSVAATVRYSQSVFVPGQHQPVIHCPQVRLALFSSIFTTGASLNSLGMLSKFQKDGKRTKKGKAVEILFSAVAFAGWEGWFTPARSGEPPIHDA